MTSVTPDPYFACSNDVAFDIPEVDEGEDFINAFVGLEAFYDGIVVEGNPVTFEPFKEQVFKEIKFSLDGKNYRFFVEEVD